MPKQKVDTMFLLKFFFAALCNSKKMSITLPMIEVNSVPDTFGDNMEIDYDEPNDRLTVKVKGKENLIIVPRRNGIIQN